MQPFITLTGTSQRVLGSPSVSSLVIGLVLMSSVLAQGVGGSVEGVVPAVDHSAGGEGHDRVEWTIEPSNGRTVVKVKVPATIKLPFIQPIPLPDRGHAHCGDGVAKVTNPIDVSIEIQSPYLTEEKSTRGIKTRIMTTLERGRMSAVDLCLSGRESQGALLVDVATIDVRLTYDCNQDIAEKRGCDQLVRLDEPSILDEKLNVLAMLADDDGDFARAAIDLLVQRDDTLVRDKQTGTLLAHDPDTGRIAHLRRLPQRLRERGDDGHVTASMADSTGGTISQSHYMAENDEIIQFDEVVALPKDLLDVEGITALFVLKQKEKHDYFVYGVMAEHGICTGGIYSSRLTAKDLGKLSASFSWPDRWIVEEGGE